MSDGDTVKTGSITVGYVIRQWGEQYDWVSDRGESDELFESIEEAEQNARAVIGDE